MKSLRLKVLALMGCGAIMLAATSCLPIQLITDLLGKLGGLLPTA